MIDISWLDLVLVFAAAGAIYLFSLLWLILPFVALLWWGRGKWGRAVLAGLVAVLSFALSVGPMLRDSYRFREPAGIARASAVLGQAPDLTGKVVAFISENDPKHDGYLNCNRLLQYSGAAKVYLLRSDGLRDATAGQPPIWSAPVDLPALVLGEAVLRTSALGDEEYRSCELGPISGPLLPIDYLMGNSINLQQAALQENLLTGPVDPAYSPRLDYYFSPVADEHRFLLSAATADLQLVSVYFSGAGFPALLQSRSYMWPRRASDADMAYDKVFAALCRDQSEACR